MSSQLVLFASAFEHFEFFSWVSFKDFGAINMCWTNKDQGTKEYPMYEDTKITKLNHTKFRIEETTIECKP